MSIRFEPDRDSKVPTLNFDAYMTTQEEAEAAIRALTIAKDALLMGVHKDEQQK